MINTERLGFCFVSQNGPEGVVTVKEMAKALKRDKEHQLSLAYMTATNRFSIIGSQGLKVEQIKKLFSSMSALLVFPKILPEFDSKGNYIVELEKIENKYGFVEHKNSKCEEHERLVQQFVETHGCAYLNNRWHAIHEFDMLLMGQQLTRLSKL